jgi:hypothetical protein
MRKLRLALAMSATVAALATMADHGAPFVEGLGANLADAVTFKR